MSPAWVQLPERGSAQALALIHWIGTSIGRPAGRMLLYPITVYFLLTARRPRRASFLYLRRVFGRPPRWWHVFLHIHCFAATILDRAFFLAGQIERFDMQVHGGDIIINKIQSGRGCLLLGSHLGSFEALRAIGLTLRRFRLKVLMNVDHNPAITRFFNALNPDLAATIIPTRAPSTLLQVHESLEQGYIVGVLGDRVVSDGKSTRCRFLGAETDFPLGPMQLAATLQCPVMLAFALYRGGNRYEIFFERFADGVPLTDRRSSQGLQAWTQRYVDRLEHYARQAPYNWFNFFDFWQEDQHRHGRRSA